MNPVTDLLNIVKPISVYKPEHVSFLTSHTEHLGKILEKTHMWRTDTQKRSIINDNHFPTDHSKFHQAILEQKVQFDQSMYLARDFELKKLEIDGLELEIDGLELEIDGLELEIDELFDDKKSTIKKKKLQIEIAFKKYELKNMQIAMEYRMQEVQGWQLIINELLEKLKNLPEEVIWQKDQGEVAAMFFRTLSNLQGLNTTVDSAERSNLIALASYAVKHVYELGRLQQLEEQCNSFQADSLKFIKELLKIKE